MNEEDRDMMDRLVAVAKARFDGHLTVLRFTTNWRVGFYQPDGREAIEAMASGATLAIAGQVALEAEGAA